jgi:hypothetical protein
VCSANSTQSCGTAGGSQTCSAMCIWGNCSCVGPTVQTGCNCTGSQTRTCNNGTWSSWSGCMGGVDTTRDPQNCGSCGHSCASGLCSASKCACPGPCPDCQTCDSGSGTCVAKANGSACSSPPAHSVASCSNGACQFQQCVSGYMHCDPSQPGPCETNIGQIPNCGSCGNDCSSEQNVSAGNRTCSAFGTGFRCSYTQCNIFSDVVSGMSFPSTDRWLNCRADGDPEFGCETSPGDFATCGACNVNCNPQGLACAQPNFPNPGHHICGGG